jgi:hypothetical protein
LLAQLFYYELFNTLFTVLRLLFAGISYFGIDREHPELPQYLPQCGPKKGGVGCRFLCIPEDEYPGCSGERAEQRGRRL